MGYSFKFNFSDSDIDFSPKQNEFHNYNKFLINEFFNSNDFEINIIMKKYRIAYGDSPYKYVLTNYFSKWRSGNRTLSNVQEQRIISIMEGSLNDVAQQKLSKIKEEARYQLGIQETLNTIKKTVKTFFSSQAVIYKPTSNYRLKLSSTRDILDLYNLELERAKSIIIRNDIIFDRIYVLDNEEIKEVLNISKYIIFIKLKSEFENILRDLSLFVTSTLFNLKGINTYSYKILGFSNKIDLSKFKFEKINTDYLIIDEIETNSRYKIFADKYLYEELITMEGQRNKDLSLKYINSFDLSIFQTNIFKLIESNKDFQSQSIFYGSGGDISITIDFKNVKKLKQNLLLNYLILLIFSSVVLYLFIIAYNFLKLFIAFILLILLGTQILFFLEKYITKIKGIHIELKKYS